MSNTAQGSARSRIEALLDDNSFVEIGAMVTARTTNFNLQTKDTPADGVITGYGVIDGNLVYVYSQDASVLNGSVGEMHAKKISNIYNLAMKMGAPVIGLIDCAGLRLQEATDALNGFGRIYLKQSMASGVIPQITAVFGNCGGGLAVFSGLTDFTFMESTKAKLFVNSPNALDGNYTAKCDTASAKFQSEEAGNVDFVGDEASIFAGIRELVTMLPANNEDDGAFDECTDDLNRVCDGLENCAGDPALAASILSDNGVFFETKKDYAKRMVTGFIKLNGSTVGLVANRTELFDEEGKSVEKYDAEICPGCAEKAADFINFCDAFNIPVLTLANVKGYVATVGAEKKIAKAVAKLTYAYANATVPKVTVVTGNALGSAYVTMGSKAIGADCYYAWPNAQIGMMDADIAAKIIASGKEQSEVSEAAKEFAKLQSTESAASRGYVDAVIEPADTRKYVIAAFEMLFTKREDRPSKKHGTV
ncbi:MAG: acyl-CoA carboxylase subunit beta [Lachnospiraceae bacterium]